VLNKTRKLSQVVEHGSYAGRHFCIKEERKVQKKEASALNERVQQNSKIT